jgi:pyruvate/2-oxoglutarate dehydrogenase complex dihydrolipoamide dehydrogenase (E3) component
MNYDYDIAIIGAGTAGLVSAFVADSLGAKTVLIEQDKVGGECLWTGCVPSKTLIKSARVYETIKGAEEFGVHVEKPRLVWGAVRMRIAAVRDEIRDLERAELQKSGIKILIGTARFQDGSTLSVTSKTGEQTLRAKKFILATGSKVRMPDIGDLAEADYLTSDTIFDLPNRPHSLLILGGGPIACEFAQAFQRFGTKCTIIQKGSTLLPREDGEISAECLRLLQRDGVKIYLNATATQIVSDDAGQHVTLTSATSAVETLTGTQLLVATGKMAALDTLNLEAAGVQCNDKGVIVDERLQTSASHIYACGDATGKFLFTHVAEYQAKIAAQNALLPLKQKADYRVVPWTTFTDPEISHLGLTEEEAIQEYGSCKVYREPFNKLDRAIIEGETDGFLKIITSGSGRIVGVHIIGPDAGELIHAFVPALRDGVLLPELAETIHVYPTLSDIGHRAGNQYYRDLLESKPVQGALGILHKLSHGAS